MRNVTFFAKRFKYWRLSNIPFLATPRGKEEAVMSKTILGKRAQEMEREWLLFSDAGSSKSGLLREAACPMGQGLP